MRAKILICHAGGELHLCHRGDGGQRLAAETHRGEREEVGSLQYLAGGVALESQTCIRLAHPRTVVDDLQARAASIHSDDVDASCTGIHSVLYQLLDDRSGTLNDLASSYLVGDAIGKEMNGVQV